MSARVLIVEDDRDIRETLAEVLVEEGYDVVTASNGAEGLTRLQAGRPIPKVILLDLMMPVMNGRQFVDQQQRSSELAAVPIIVLSADGAHAEHAASIHAAGCLRKPLHLGQLLDMVAGICSEGTK
jgi:CheY-like chemotaxis protein